MIDLEKLKIEMTKRNLDQIDVSESIGCSQALVSQILSETRNITKAMEFRLLELFGDEILKVAKKWVEVIEDPNVHTHIRHSETKAAWNVIGESLEAKYKIARLPYYACDNEEVSARNRSEALLHAKFISHCFNNSRSICVK